ncbi:hypothetical protein [Streptomyces sp. NBC_00829]|uniref:hypothetical protein n=1 Tax=Streptomyces sp. NBC_00829 TaxID=2903679 RepID=UPI00386D8690|nr:hypothetical protein OG293_37045 [Streptomyces sp. NBC_00829]
MHLAEISIAHSEFAALTRRFEEVAEKHDREFGIIKSDLTSVRLQIGDLDQKVEALNKKIDRNQAQIIGLLAQLVGQRPDVG